MIAQEAHKTNTEKERKESMKIVVQYGDFTKAEIFNLTKGAGTLLKNVEDGKIIDIEKLVVIQDDKLSKDGEIKTTDIMHIVAKDGVTYSTESPTFQKTVLDAVEFMETEQLTFELVRQKSKAGRVFMDAKLI